MLRSALVATVIVLCSLVGPASTALSAEPNSMTASTNALMPFLVQSVCLGGGGRVRAALPIDPECSTRRAQTESDIATYRKYDWPNSNEADRKPLGYQASDAVVSHRGGRTLIVQTFDFGDGNRKFGRFDAGLGDGGQVLVVVGGWASAIMTEDGGDGVQYFIGPGCQSAPQTDAGELSWLFFSGDVSRDKWHSVEAHLNKGRSIFECPPVFNAAFTRYRADTIDVPLRVVTKSAPLTDLVRPLDVIVSEHYGGAQILSADHLERFFFARDLGLVRWERWENFQLPKAPAVATMAVEFARTGRCRPWTYSTAPGSDWRMIDCRNWTTLAAPSAPWSVGDYRWPALDALGPRQ
jgi:hypothetical protein